ncbi:hypothetical protein AB7714_28360 [Tardiphaga sp. 1201_B9_N1_1]|uniref:hypothetical protein n=1 Tax=unclassified Tardiphaga TaxID=2631404 RepID=UPI003F23476A
MALVDQIVNVESGGNPNARNPRSSAGGAGQFIDSAWLNILSKHRPELIQGKSRDEIIALKGDPVLSKEMTGALAADNGGILTGAGLPVTPGTTYLAHFAGPQGAIGILNADPTTPAGAVLGPRVVEANPFLKDMSAADLKAWADRKMGGGEAPAAPIALSMSGGIPSTTIAAQSSDNPAELEQQAPTQPRFLGFGEPPDDPAQQQAPLLLPPRPRLRLQAPAQTRGFSFRGTR